jgi:hypothetical protein
MSFAAVMNALSTLTPDFAEVSKKFTWMMGWGVAGG